ncbi:MAG: phosphohydrolase [Desulfobacteraceae bacterium 4572_87]|nr:MAG: phosphohydrolase [Desulfobacteraceae bacterium 4572_87]
MKNKLRQFVEDAEIGAVRSTLRRRQRKKGGRSVTNQKRLLDIRLKLDEKEREILSPWACFSCDALRRREESRILLGHRQNYSLDTDRILHSMAYSRYIDKTQVFYLVKNDHITHRVLHVQLVSKIARTISRLLRLNEDLTEAVALGHDIGHTPFGHDGERFLSDLCESHGVGRFLHNIQSVRSLENLEKKGAGCNLSLQVLDGIFCHDGELHSQFLKPRKEKGFGELVQEMKMKAKDPFVDVVPMTLEGCVVRMADTISYIGRDIEDAIRLGLIQRNDIPDGCRSVLGDSNGTIVYNLVEDLVANSLEQPNLNFSARVGEALQALKRFNRENIYKNTRVKKQTSKVKLMFSLLFEKLFEDLNQRGETSVIYDEFLKGMSESYRAKTPAAGMVRDFIAGMTDEFFMDQCQKHLIPKTTHSLF